MAHFNSLIVWVPWGIPAGVFLASILGSLHCVSMCGALISNVAVTRTQVIQYHMARLLSYSVLGAISGYLGSQLLIKTWSGPIGMVAGAIAATLMIFAASRAWQGQSFHLPWPKQLQNRLYRYLGSAPAAGVGLLTGLLPCGWLYTFILAALATGNTWRGASVLIAFWLGTLPALSALPWIVRSPRVSPRISAVVLLAAGLFTLSIKFGPIIFPGTIQADLICGH